MYVRVVYVDKFMSKGAFKWRGSRGESASFMSSSSSSSSSTSYLGISRVVPRASMHSKTSTTVERAPPRLPFPYLVIQYLLLLASLIFQCYNTCYIGFFATPLLRRRQRRWRRWLVAAVVSPSQLWITRRCGGCRGAPTSSTCGNGTQRSRWICVYDCRYCYWLYYRFSVQTG